MQQQIGSGSSGLWFAIMLLLSFAPAALAQTPTKIESYVPSKFTAQAKKGQQLYSTLHCSNCHSIANGGGCLAPKLDGVGARRSSQYMELRLKDQAEEKFINLIGHPELFPHPRFAPSEVKQLVAYLLTLPRSKGSQTIAHHKTNLADEPAITQTGFKPHPISSDSAQGRRLFLDGGCMACHSIGVAGADLAPRLDGIGGRHTRKYIEAHISNPQAHLASQSKTGKAKSKMPQFEFAANEVAQIAEFLLTLPDQR